jgi:hypothetical protein
MKISLKAFLSIGKGWEGVNGKGEIPIAVFPGIGLGLGVRLDRKKPGKML